VVNAVAMIGASYADAEDAVQDALVRAWTDDVRRPIERLDAWVTVVAWNRTRSGFRRLGAERRARACLAETERAPDHTTNIDATVDVTRALASLPRRLREVAVLRYLLQLSTHETAVALGIADGTVKRALADARLELAAALAIADGEVFADDQDR
jgi:RNA polymerase sigma factor (sigma-70 family)